MKRMGHPGSLFLAAVLWLAASWGLAAGGPVDVRVVIDISGSMKETDPQNLRVPALNLVVELLPEGSRAGVWTFGQYVNNTLPVGEVDNRWRNKARAAAREINSSGQRTNLTEALAKAGNGTRSNSRFDQSIILLTDGKIDMAPRLPVMRLIRRRVSAFSEKCCQPSRLPVSRCTPSHCRRPQIVRC